MEKSGLLSAPLSEFLIQAHFRPQAMRHSPPDALTIFAERGQYPVGFFLDDLYPANTGDVYPLAAGDVIRQRLQVTFDGLPNEGFCESTPLASDMGNSLGVVHSDSPFEY
jgi:hypothetical protein